MIFPTFLVTSMHPGLIQGVVLFFGHGLQRQIADYRLKRYLEQNVEIYYTFPN